MRVKQIRKRAMTLEYTIERDRLGYFSVSFGKEYNYKHIQADNLDHLGVLISLNLEFPDYSIHYIKNLRTNQYKYSSSSCIEFRGSLRFADSSEELRQKILEQMKK